MKRIVFTGLAIIGLAVLFTGCMKKGDEVEIPAAGLMSFNLAPDQQSVVITLSGNTASRAPMGYTSYSGLYQNIFIGTRSVESFDYPEQTPLASTEFNFEKDKYYSVFVVGANDNYRNVVVVDNFDSLNANSGKAYVRYINAITDSVNAPAVSITAGGSTSTDNAAFASVSEFKEVAPGEISFAVKNGTAIDANRSFTVEAKKVYTVLLVGVPGETDEMKKVQIRFIQNGSLTDEDGK